MDPDRCASQTRLPRLTRLKAEDRSAIAERFVHPLSPSVSSNQLSARERMVCTGSGHVGEIDAEKGGHEAT